MDNIGIYIHIPFCDGKCAYCNFFSRRADESTIDHYTEKLKDSIRLWGSRLSRTADTVYFGGGTPSLLGHKRLDELIDCVRGSFSIGDNAEITLEANPTSTDELDFRALRDHGFNRLSVGLQSYDDRELRALGRRHSAEDAARTVKRARSAGFDNISLDVMLAVPYQTADSLDRTLEFCARQNVSHISSYILKIEPGTRFFAQRDTLPLFTDDEQAALYERAVTRLGELGYRQYEISNFSREGCESRHNLRYWHDEEYIGLGPSAHSFIGGERFYYADDFDSFYRGETVYEGKGGEPEEYIMLALRLTEGLIYKSYEQRYDKPVDNKFLNRARVLEKKGLCTVGSESIKLTVKGFLVSNPVIAYLLGY